MIPETKRCGMCNIVKKACEFPLRKKKGKYVWLRLQCYECMKEVYRNRYSVNREKVIKRNREYEVRNASKVKERQIAWRSANSEKISKLRAKKYLDKADIIKDKRKEYYYKNKEKVIRLNNDYVQRNKAKVRERQRRNHSKKKKNDISYSMLKTLRTRVYAAIKNGGTKSCRTIDLIGCSIPDLLLHLELQFTDGMNWDNRGLYGWHIDHKIPCSSFDMTNPEEQKKCFHYTNLQPLWAKDNLKKGVKIVFNNNLK